MNAANRNSAELLTLVWKTLLLIGGSLLFGLLVSAVWVAFQRAESSLQTWIELVVVGAALAGVLLLTRGQSAGQLAPRRAQQRG